MYGLVRPGIPQARYSCDVGEPSVVVPETEASDSSTCWSSRLHSKGGHLLLSWQVDYISRIRPPLTRRRITVSRTAPMAAITMLTSMPCEDHSLSPCPGGHTSIGWQPSTEKIRGQSKESRTHRTLRRPSTSKCPTDHRRQLPQSTPDRVLQETPARHAA